MVECVKKNFGVCWNDIMLVYNCQNRDFDEGVIFEGVCCLICGKVFF